MTQLFQQVLARLEEDYNTPEFDGNLVEQVYKTANFFYNFANYRSHPKDEEGTVFTGVGQSTPGGSTPVPGSCPGLWSQVLSGGTPVPGFSQVSGPQVLFKGSIPVPDSFPGFWCYVLSGGYTCHS